MSRSRPEPDTMAGAYALDALAGADQARFERHLARCQQCVQEVRGLREATARLAVAAAAEPPAGLTERACAQAASSRQLPPAPRSAWVRRASQHPARSRPAAGRPWRGWQPRLAFAIAAAATVISVLAAVAVHATAHRLDQEQERANAVAAVLTAPDATMLAARVSTGGTATIVMSRRHRELVFVAAGLRLLPSSRCYELWLMGPNGDRAAAMLPHPRQGMTGPVIASGLTGRYDRLGLTIEPAGGAPHPSSAVILLVAL